jgi:high-affinity Fe2+/Pb2+ permease
MKTLVEKEFQELRVVVGSLINAVALGLLLSWSGQIYFNTTGFVIGFIVGLLLSIGATL